MFHCLFNWRFDYSLKFIVNSLVHDKSKNNLNSRFSKILKCLVYKGDLILVYMDVSFCTLSRVNIMKINYFTPIPPVGGSN